MGGCAVLSVLVDLLLVLRISLTPSIHPSMSHDSSNPNTTILTGLYGLIVSLILSQKNVYCGAA